jgi:hypothetical protein
MAFRCQQMFDHAARQLDERRRETVFETRELVSVNHGQNLT